MSSFKHKAWQAWEFILFFVIMPLSLLAWWFPALEGEGIIPDAPWNYPLAWIFTFIYIVIIRSCFKERKEKKNASS